jgi:hypothetical protein
MLVIVHLEQREISDKNILFRNMKEFSFYEIIRTFIMWDEGDLKKLLLFS